MALLRPEIAEYFAQLRIGKRKEPLRVPHHFRYARGSAVDKIAQMLHLLVPGAHAEAPAGLIAGDVRAYLLGQGV